MVEYALLWSNQSKADLKEIFNYIKNAESSERAKYVVTEIRIVANQILFFTTKHTIESAIIDETVRYAVIWSYKILFTIGEKHVNIVRIFQTAQNPNRI